ncbi:MAG: arsenite S-adenosylmethyltransferase [Candidatus Glassbacteria bacterium RIFCSPLOWO2_12_FULL_58_11]|uniref:Arsenite methyltransferase n=1 Tax=Candidatus Glassbacteria bacterium RIFCSPLOWO2_12_FULL_58_11 TaxID=1817867 RepID=A0A1F5YWX3_9BACT|nr:MAG: arsenite S-adenosylmethyltransferase [Candidatus Glassbacteria bacterium RIFCSPLOWO2_12_FULL_58_11]
MEARKTVIDPETVRENVREAYSKVASQGTSCCGSVSPCSGPVSAEQLAKAVGYSEKELASLPSGANLGLSCGNPTAIASLKPGEVVLDLGSGGGFDVFIAAEKVGAKGKVIGVDMTPEMIGRARRNLAAYRERSGLDNAEFRLGEIEHLPAEDSSVDVVISNCVINLSADKAQVWREVGRVLRPGGRVAVSDLALLRPLPSTVLESIEALVGCVAGAVLVEDTRRMIQAAGLTEIELTPKPDYIQSMNEWKDPLYLKIINLLPEGSRVEDYLTSLGISARKPR